MIYFHADDYGISKSQTDMICECFDGKLNSVSLMPNSAYLSEAARRLPKECRKVVHLNFIEGPCMASPKQIPLLATSEGMLNCSFMKALKYSLAFPKKRREAFHQFRLEIEAQIMAVVRALRQTNDSDGIKLSIDSHQHLHMVPIVFRALMTVLKKLMDNDIIQQVDCIRVSVDPFKVLLSKPNWILRVPVKNYIKWCILKILSLGKKKKIAKIGGRVPVFFGIFFTCQMEEKVVNAFLASYEKIAREKKSDLELMFHPGAVYALEELLDSGQSDLVRFYKSDNRKKEKEYLLVCK